MDTVQQQDAQSGITRYRRLSRVERDDMPKNRCGYLLENGMQCPSSGYIFLLDKNYTLCAFHTTNAMAIADANKQPYTEVKD